MFLGFWGFGGPGESQATQQYKPHCRRIPVFTRVKLQTIETQHSFAIVFAFWINSIRAVKIRKHYGSDVSAKLARNHSHPDDSG